MEKNVEQTGNVPVSYTEIFGLLNSRIHEQSKVVKSQSEKINDLIEIVNVQNEALISCRSQDSQHRLKIILAQKYINKMIADIKKEVDTEAA